MDPTGPDLPGLPFTHMGTGPDPWKLSPVFAVHGTSCSMKGPTSYFAVKILKAGRQIRHQMDAKRIHAFRLGVKRLYALWAFREWVTGKRVSGPDRKQILKAFKRSGVLRDIQVRHQILEDDLRHLSRKEQADIQTDQKKARRRFLDQIRHRRLSPKYLAKRIQKWAAFIDRMSEEQLMINGETFYLRGMERLHQLAVALSDDHVLHQIRKEIKHLIYIGQFLEEVLPGRTPWHDRLPVLMAVAARIGEWHDLQLLPSRTGSEALPGQQAESDTVQARNKALLGIDQLLGLDAAQSTKEE